jgi:hypothetical protein
LRPVFIPEFAGESKPERTDSMKTSIRSLLGGAVLLTYVIPATAGGLFVILGNPEANPQARAIGAVLTLKVNGCHEPEKAEVSARAIRMANGRQESFPLKLTRLAGGGSYAVTQQWPAESRSVLEFIARDGQRVTSTLVASGPHGIERNNAKMAMKMPAESDVAALLAGRSKAESVP